MKKILIIDDDKMFLKVVNDWFAFKGFEVVITSDDKEAFSILNKENIDAILLDVMMQPLSGLDILAILKRDPKLKDIPVFMLSQLGEEDYMESAKELGAEDYLIKSDFSLKELLLKIEAAIAKNRAKDVDAAL